MMEINKVPDGKGGTYIVMTSSDIENVNPIDFYGNWHMKSKTVKLNEIRGSVGFQYFDDELELALDKAISEQVQIEWDEKYNEIKRTKIPENLKQLFGTKRKKDQIKLLKGLSITSDILIAFLFYAYEQHGYTFSQYTAEHSSKGVEKGDMPTFVHVDEDKVERIGRSDLTDGQLKQAIQHRKVVNAKFVEKGEDWHCLFATYKSLNGKENWQNGQPHFHYISSKFGIPREDVIESLKSKHYKLGSLPHVNLTDYGVQPETEESHKKEEYNPKHDESLWRYIRMRGPLTYQDYLNKYPNGKYADEAKKILKEQED